MTLGHLSPLSMLDFLLTRHCEKSLAWMIFLSFSPSKKRNTFEEGENYEKW